MPCRLPDTEDELNAVAQTSRCSCRYSLGVDAASMLKRAPLSEVDRVVSRMASWRETSMVLAEAVVSGAFSISACHQSSIVRRNRNS